jgi:hypothetical protein
MSLAALADEEILRRDRRNLDLTAVIKSRVDPVITNLKLPDAGAAQLREALKPLATEPPIPKTPPSNALDGLVKYIPTESITLYLAVTSAISSFTTTFPWLTPYRLYWGFVVFTPVLFLLIYLGKRRSQKLPVLPPKWPIWKLIASTIAFAVWALAVPPLVTSEAGKVVVAVLALVISTILSLVGGLVEEPEA